MKKVLQVVMIIVIFGLGYILVKSLQTPIEFTAALNGRTDQITERLKDIRTAQRAYKQINRRYVSTFDSLINFVLTDSMKFTKAIGSEDDSIAVAKKLVSRVDFKMAVIDTIFGARKLTPEQVKNLRYVPHTNGQEFIMGAGNVSTGSKVVVPVFECKAPYKMFLSDLNEQELINLIDESKSLGKYPGLKVGSLTEATNDAGNWE